VAHHSLRLKIDSSALVANWRWLAAQAGQSCGAAVKADGYGIGARETVRHLAAAGCRDFFVATWPEAEALMPWAEGLNLSVLHGVGPDDGVAAAALPARPVLNSAAQIARWRAGAADRPCDIMVDTCMNRLGIAAADVGAGLLEGLRIETLMSHLACADEPGHPLNTRQLLRFRELIPAIPARRFSLANSAGICLGADYGFDLTRPGIALYGGIPVPGDQRQETGLRQVVSIEARLIQVREVPTGETVGYGATYVAREPRRIGILSIGYADGYLRALASSGLALAADRSFPVAGRVSMDLLAVDLGSPADAGPREGDWLAVDYRLPRLAAGSGLSQYELLTTLGHRYERIWH
jgi:alanine racemase